jgi:hypothetical protein
MTTRKLGALAGAGALAFAALGGTAAVQAPAAFDGTNSYLYTGGGASSEPAVKPAEIHTQDGEISARVGEPIPPASGRPKDFPGWNWSLRPTAVSMGWATLGTGTGDVIQDVIGVGYAPLPGHAGSFYFQCLSYLPTPSSQPKLLHYDMDTGKWGNITAQEQAADCRNTA